MDSTKLDTTEHAPVDGLRPGDQPHPANRPRYLPYVALGLVALVAIATMGLRYPDERDHAIGPGVVLVTGQTVRVDAPVTGHVRRMNVDVGDLVQGGQVIGAMDRGAAPGEPLTDTRLVDVTAPVSGMVVARYANPGSTLTAGELLLTIAELQA